MNLFFDTELGKQQNKTTHKIRVMSEAWLEKNDKLRDYFGCG